MRGVTKEQIIRTVLDVSFEKGVASVSLADVADRVGIKKASLYNHIESRDEMFESTFAYCSSFLEKLNYIPSDIESVASRYSAEVILKGIIRRRFKMHEKPPLLQIYFFVQSQKYFDERAWTIAKAHEERFKEQIKEVLDALGRAARISLREDLLGEGAAWFCALSDGLFCDMLIGQRHLALSLSEGEPPKPHTAEDERVSLLVERFCKLL